MITDASITEAADGTVLIEFLRSGMDPMAPTDVAVVGTMLKVGQNGGWFVEAEFSADILESVLKAPAIEIAETSDDLEFELHEDVRRVE